MTRAREPKIRVDFNNITDDGLIRAHRKLADASSLEEGAPIVLYDAEGGGVGNRCLGIIRTVGENVVHVEVVPSTWIDVKPVKLVSPPDQLVDALFEKARLQIRTDPPTVARTTPPAVLKST